MVSDATGASPQRILDVRTQRQEQALRSVDALAATAHRTVHFLLDIHDGAKDQNAALARQAWLLAQALNQHMTEVVKYVGEEHTPEYRATLPGNEGDLH
ncbi:MAG: hypothetical protein NVS4B3_05370 [Gemmatimonadaceae bacterium]